jgi:type I restriction enzyme S subunit
MTIPTLRFKADDSSKFGEWKSIQLKDIAERIARKNKEENQNALTISAQMGLVNQQAYFSKQIASRDLSKYYLLHKGEYAYNKSYSAGYPMGAIKRLKLYEKGVVSTLYICFSLNKQVNSDFFEQYVESGNLVPELEKIAQEGARNHGLLNISLQEFFEINLIVPCLKEQMKIATFLSAVDKKISQLSQKHQLLSQYKQGMMQKLFSQQIRFKADDGSEFGEWEYVFLGDISKPQQWKTISSSELTEIGYPVFGANGYIGFYPKYNHINETIAVTCRGATCGEVTLVKAKSYITGNAMSIDEINENEHLTLYIYYALCFRGFKDVISGSAQPQIVGNAIRKVTFQIPCLEEQTKIANFLSAIDQKIDVVSEQLEQAKLWKKGLLQQMFV